MAPKRKPKSELGKTAKYYRENPEKVAKKDAKSKAVNKRASQKRKRAELGKKRREAIKRGVDTSKSDFDHAVGKRVPVSTNRGRKEKSRLKGSTRKKK